MANLRSTFDDLAGRSGGRKVCLLPNMAEEDVYVNLEIPKTGNHKLSFYTKHMTYLMYPGMFVSNSQPWGMIPRFKITI